MRKTIFSKALCSLALLFAFSSFAQAQLTGTKTIPGDYASITLAVADLNTQGVGAGGVTFNVAAGYTESNVAVTLTMATNPPNATRPVVFQKSGAGANPLLTAGTGTTTTTDGIIKLDGVDYVTFNGIDLIENAANVTATTQMEWGYALVKNSATNGCQNVTIKNCTVTLSQANTASTGIYSANHTATSTTGLTVTAFAGTNSYNQFLNNTISDAYFGYQINGFGSGAPYDYYDQNNKIGVDGVSTRRSQVLKFGGGAVTASGIQVTNQNGIIIANTYLNNSGGLTTTAALNGIALVAGTTSNATVNNDTIQLSSLATTSNLYAINNTLGGTGAGNTINIYNNVISNCTYTSSTSGEFRGISSTTTASYTNIYNNTISGITLPGTGQFTGIYYSGSSLTLCLAVNIYNNTVSNNTKSGTGGNFNCIYASGSTYVTNTYGNTMSNNSNAASSGETYGYYNFAVGANENVYNNTVSGLAGGTGRTNGLRIESGSGPTNKEVYGNQVSNVTGNTTANFGGISIQYGTVNNVYKNTVSNIVNNNATGGTPAVFGMQFDANNNVQVNCNNNYISDLRAPSASNTGAVFGINVIGSTSSDFGFYFNTIYLNATSTGANFGSSAINISTSPLRVDLQNNIFANASSALGIGTTKALSRGGTALTNYSLTSGYNCYYVPSATGCLIYSDGTNNDATMAAFKARVGAREQGSFRELPPFTNIAAAPYNLHLLAGSPTNCESGGSTIAGITTDFDGQNRYPNAGFPTAGFAVAPDVGADEIGGNFSDISPPNIVYTPLGNSSVSTTRTLTGFAVITDPSGVNNTAGTKPRLYYKKSTHANTYNSNTNATDGWKYVEASNAVSPYNFTIDYTLVFGGSVVAGDIIQYFVVAQDLNGTPNVGINQGGFTVAPTSVNLAAGAFPAFANAPSTINQYTIVTAGFTGVVPVGPTEVITSLTNAGGAFALINAGVLSGNLTLSITGDLTAETGTFALNQWAEEGVGNYTLSIVPNGAVVRTISGSNAGTSLIRFDGADRVTIDGRFGGVGNFLRFRNTSNAAPTIGYLNDAQNNTLTYTIVESGNTSTTAATAGAVNFGTTSGLNGNDNNTVSFCELRDRSDVAGTPTILLNIAGTASALSTYNNNITISNNNFHDWFLLNGTTQIALQASTGFSGLTITGNSFYQTATRTHTVTGSVTRAINLAFASTVNSNGGNTITGNFIGGTAPGCTGGDMTYTVSGAGVSQVLIGIAVTTGQIPNSIQGNTITKIDFTTNAPAAASSIFVGMQFVQGVFNVGNITGNVIGGAGAQDLIKLNVNTGGATNTFIAGILAAPANGYMNLQNNTIGGITVQGTNTTALIFMQFIQLQGTPSAANTVSGNLIGSTTVANSNRILQTIPTVFSFGLRQTITTGAPLTCANNTIQNFTSTSTSTGSSDFGIFVTSTVGLSAPVSITGNTIANMSDASAPTAPAFTVQGIVLAGFAGNGHNISNNTLSGLYATNISATAAGYVSGIQTNGNNCGGTMSKNKVSDFRNASTGGLAGTVGIYMIAGNNWTVSNNMVSLTNPTGTNPVFIGGIYDGGSGTTNVYYNSVYIGGSAASGAANSYAYTRANSSAVTLRNNLLYNERAGGTGFHYAAGNVATTPAYNWVPGGSNNNYFVSADANRMGEWGAATGQAFAQWQSSSGGDANSFYELNTAIPSATIFTNTATANLKVPGAYYTTPSNLESNGVTVAGIAVDYENDARPGPAGSVNGGGTAPDIGADEFDGTLYIYDAAAFALGEPEVPGCYTAGDTVAMTVRNTGNVTLDFVAKPLTVNANVTGPNPAVFGPITVNTGTLAPGADLLVTLSTNYDMSSLGTYVFNGTISMTGDEVSANNTLSTVTITIAGGTASATPNPVCAGALSTLSVTGYTLGGEVQWQESPDNVTWTNIAGANTPSYGVYPTDTMYYRAVICGLHNSSTVTLLVNPAPIVNLGPDAIICTGSTVLDAGNIGASYAWSTSGVSQTETVNATGVYSVTVTDGNTCQGIDTISLTFNTPPLVNLGVDTTQCGGSVLLDAGNAGATYNWSTTDVTQTLNVTATGNYIVTVTANGCDGIDSVLVTINAVPVVDLGADTTACGDLTLDAGNPGAAYNWSTTETTQTITVTSSATINVTVTENGCTGTDGIVVTINPLPTVSLSLGQDTVCQELGSVTLSGGTPAGGTYSGPGVSGTNFDPTVAGLGTHTITYTFTDANGCTNSNTDTWFVEICTGIDDAQPSFGMNLFPNPNNGQFTLSLDGLGGDDLHITVFSAEGKAVWVKDQDHAAGEFSTDIDLSHVSRGVYLVKVQAGDKVQMNRVVTE